MSYFLREISGDFHRGWDGQDVVSAAGGVGRQRSIGDFPFVLDIMDKGDQEGVQVGPLEPDEVSEIKGELEIIKGLFDVKHGLSPELHFVPAADGVDLELGVITGESEVTDREGVAIDGFLPPLARVPGVVVGGCHRRRIGNKHGGQPSGDGAIN